MKNKFMKTLPTVVSTLICLAAVTSCSKVPLSAYSSRGGPETLLDVSSEQVTLQLTDPASLDELVTWVNEDQPTKIILGCMEADMMCSEAMSIANQFAIPTQHSGGVDNTVTLVYERVIARDCENRYIDNPHNPYNLNHPSFGCSTAANTLQMISDKQQIIAPSLMDYHDGEKTIQALEVYTEPSISAQEKLTFEEVFEFSGDSQ